MVQATEVRQWIINYLAELTDRPKEQIDPDCHVANDYGLDSYDAVVLAGALEEQFDLEIEAALFLRNATINDLVSDLQANGIIT